MVSKSDLPELDDPAAVSQLGARFASIGMLNKSIIDEAKYGWTNTQPPMKPPKRDRFNAYSKALPKPPQNLKNARRQSAIGSIRTLQR